MDYEDLEIEIRSDGDGGWEAALRSESRGFGREPFVVPVDSETLERVMDILDHRVWASRIGSRELEVDPEPQADSPDEPTREKLERLGRDLYDALFRGANAQVWYSTCAKTGADGGPMGIRLKFLQHWGSADHPKPQSLPWELIQRPDNDEYVARCRATPIVRALQVPQLRRPAPVGQILRVLLVEASPADQPYLATAVEARQILAALQRVDGVEVTHLEHADFQTFHRQLSRGDFHVVHFMGHGGFDHDSGEPGLVFEEAGRKAQFVPARTFAEYVKQPQSVWLVVLNSCSSAALFRRNGQDPFTSAAAALSVQRIPAVVAMQFRISDQAAIVFSQAFYDALIHQDHVDVAVTEGRLAICQKAALEMRAAEETLEWVTPVVYFHGKEVRLFGEDAERGSALQPEQEPETTPLRLGIRSMEGHGIGLEEDAERTLDLVEYFDVRYIRNPEAWHAEILPRIQEFLADAVRSRRPLVLDLACHGSLAFAVGSFLEYKSGVDLSVVQRGQQTSLFELPARPGEIVEGPVWREPSSEWRDDDAEDVAVAISVTRPALRDVHRYLDKADLRLSRRLDMTIAGGPSQTSVRDGAHALRLAQTLSHAIRDKSEREWLGTSHLFWAAPNALAVFLGREAPALGTVQLYEFEFDKGSDGTYWPSFRMPPE